LRETKGSVAAVDFVGGKGKRRKRRDELSRCVGERKGGERRSGWLGSDPGAGHDRHRRYYGRKGPCVEEVIISGGKDKKEEKLESLEASATVGKGDLLISSDISDRKRKRGKKKRQGYLRYASADCRFRRGEDKGERGRQSCWSTTSSSKGRREEGATVPLPTWCEKEEKDTPSGRLDRTAQRVRRSWIKRGPQGIGIII